MLDKIREIVRSEAEEDDWKFHIVPVVNYSKKLAKLLHADVELAELAALLHDIGRIKFGGENHEVTGVPEAEKILISLKYPQDVIDEVKHCIASHRGSRDIPPKTTIAKIVANADAMAQFDILPVFFFWRSKDSSFEEGFKWVDEKFSRNWDKKLTIPEAKNMVEEKYKAIKLILDTTREYL